MRKIGFFKIIVAFLFIIVGIGLILSNIGVISLEINEAFHYIYQIFFVIYGIKLMIDFFRGSRGSWIFGSFLLVFGGLLLLGTFEIIPFVFSDIWQLWPLLLVYIGVGMFTGGRSHKRKKVKFEFSSDDNSKRKEIHKVGGIGDVNFTSPNWNLEPLDLWNAIGDYKIDFSKAFIPEGKTPIHIGGWIGDVHILIPEHIPVSIDAVVKTGDIKLFGQRADGFNRQLHFASEDYENATRKLSITIELKIGDIRIDQV
ncbi:cell wall-active antibiotics response protein LiaF [Bacillaceae bacterium S4-13-58]